MHDLARGDEAPRAERPLAPTAGAALSGLAPPTQPSHWQPAAATYPINGGTAVPVFRDFFDAPRTGNHLGAVNP